MLQNEAASQAPAAPNPIDESHRWMRQASRTLVFAQVNGMISSHATIGEVRRFTQEIEDLLHAAYIRGVKDCSEEATQQNQRLAVVGGEEHPIPKLDPKPRPEWHMPREV